MLTMFYQCWQVWGEKIISYTRGSNVKGGKELKANKRKWSTLLITHAGCFKTHTFRNWLFTVMGMDLLLKGWRCPVI